MGVLFPISATTIPSIPKSGEKPDMKRPTTPMTSVAPARPAIAPDSSMIRIRVAGTFTPPHLAKSGLTPQMCSSYPNFVLCTINQNSAMQMSPRTTP